jgi:hypothetical protein
LAKGVDCGKAKDSAVTHVNADNKPSITLVWKPPKDIKGSVVFVATVAQDFKTYWVGIQSSKVDLDGTVSGGLTNTSSAESSMTSTTEKTTGMAGKVAGGSGGGHPVGSAMSGNRTTTTAKPKPSGQERIPCGSCWPLAAAAVLYFTLVI